MFDTEALRQWADMPAPEDPVKARQLWAQLRDDAVEACNVIDELVLRIEVLETRAAK